MKTVNAYGVEMSFIDEMKFSKFLSNNNIAMNTKTVEERKLFAENWLAGRIVTEDSIAGTVKLNLEVGDKVIARVKKVVMAPHKGYMDLYMTVIQKDMIESGPDAGEPFWRGKSNDGQIRSFTSKEVLFVNPNV